jgi:hypothetical protein
VFDLDDGIGFYGSIHVQARIRYLTGNYRTDCAHTLHNMSHTLYDTV